jgi:hypothetical protein
MAEHPDGGLPDVISSDCPLGGHHIAQGFDRNSLGAPPLEAPSHTHAHGLRPQVKNEDAGMKPTGKITRDSLMTLEAYSEVAQGHKPAIIAHRKLRSVRLGEHINLQFESETSMRYQIQEMLRIEKIFEEEGIEQEIEAYAPLMPDGSNWKGMLMLEYPDVNERKRELARLIGVEDRMFVEVEGHDRVYAIADEDWTARTTRRPRPCILCASSWTPAMCAAVKAGAGVKLGCDHTCYPAHTTIAPETLASLASDLH